ncbi:MAG: hypothetical protein ACJAW8_002057 [Oleispira sp.]|jgi:hypothetical protein
MKNLLVVLFIWGAAANSFSENLRDMFSSYESIDTRRPNIVEVTSEYGETPTFRSNIIHKDHSVCYEYSVNNIYVVISSGSIEGGIYLTRNKNKNWVCTHTKKDISSKFGGIFIGQYQDDFYLVMNSIGIKSSEFLMTDNNSMSYHSHKILELDKDIASSAGQEFYDSHVTVRVNFTNRLVSGFSVVYMESM